MGSGVTPIGDILNRVHSWVPAVLAVVAAALIAAGTVLRQRESHTSGAITWKWWIGAMIALSGFLSQAAALGLGSILLVQPLVMLTVLFALPMEAWADRRRPLRVEWAWGVLLVACVTVFLVISRPEPSARRPDDLLMVVTSGGVIIGLLLCVVAAERSNRHYKALLYGVSAGVLFGISALLVKAVAYQLFQHFWHTFSRPEIYLFLVVVVFAIVAQQRAFGAGELQTSFPALTVMELIVSMALGVLLLGENLHVSVPTAIFLGLVLAVMVRSVLELTKLAAARAEWFEQHSAEQHAVEPVAQDSAGADRRDEADEASRPLGGQ